MATRTWRESQRDLDRRLFLKGATLAAVPIVGAASASGALGQERSSPSGAKSSFAGVIRRQVNPDNLEFPFQTLDSFLTPNDQFYVRTHFGTPELEAKSWRLAVEGAVDNKLELGFDELRQMESRTVTALLECSGNSRVLLTPPQLGIRWEQGGVSNAKWTGVPLSTVLKRAGVSEKAVEVILEGADEGEFKEPNPKSPGKISYARSLPLEKAKQPEVILAYQMNGEDLPPAHGYPVRAIVPGHYGMASVKWLKRIVLTERPFHGYFQTFMYSIWQRRDGLPDLVPVSEIQVKSQIARPAFHEIVPAKSKYRLFGAAWTGEADIETVEVSTDGGTHWAKAQLLEKPVHHAWRFWEYAWEVPSRSGRYTLMSRATDSRGNVQPIERDDDRRDAMINHVQSIEVEVK